MEKQPSIFEFADKFGYKSAFEGDWLAKEKEEREKQKQKRQNQPQHKKTLGTKFYYNKKYDKLPPSASKIVSGKEGNVEMEFLGYGDDGNTTNIAVIYNPADIQKLLTEKAKKGENNDYIIPIKTMLSDKTFPKPNHYYQFDLAFRDEIIKLMDNVLCDSEHGILHLWFNDKNEFIRLADGQTPEQGNQPFISQDKIHESSWERVKQLSKEGCFRQITSENDKLVLLKSTAVKKQDATDKFYYTDYEYLQLKNDFHSHTDFKNSTQPNIPSPNLDTASSQVYKRTLDETKIILVKQNNAIVLYYGLDAAARSMFVPYDWFQTL